jgi:hypothetical protein
LQKIPILFHSSYFILKKTKIIKFLLLFFFKYKIDDYRLLFMSINKIAYQLY